MKKITVSVAEDIKQKYVKMGMMFIIIGLIGTVTRLIPIKGTLELAVSIVNLVISCACLLICARSLRFEADCFDEMAKQHLYEAKSYAGDNGNFILLIMVLIVTVGYRVASAAGIIFPDASLVIGNLGINLYMVYIGITHVLIGSKFATLEAE